MSELKHPSIHRTLVGFDFSKRSREAAESAFYVAATCGARVHVAASLPGHIDKRVLIDLARSDPDTFGVIDGAPDADVLLESGLQSLRAVCATLETSEVEWTVSTSLESPIDMMSNIVEEVGADLVFVGSTGAGNIKRWLVGSTTERLIRGLPRPVWVVKEHKPLTRILCPIDVTPSSARAFLWAWSLSRRFDAELHVLHAYEESRERTHEEARISVDRFIDASGAKEDIDELHFQVAEPADLICGAAAHLGAELVVVGNKRRQGVSAMILGSTANRVLHSMPTSIAVI